MKSLLLKLNFLTLFFWILPAIRQYKTKYFWYFFILAIADWLGLAYQIFINNHNNHIVYIIIYYLCFMVVIPKENFKKLHHLVILVVFILMWFMIPYIWTSAIICGIINIAILFVFIQHFLNNLTSEKEIDIFIFFLIFYELTLVAKFWTLMTGSSNHYFYYYITNLLDTFLAIVFTVFRYGDQKLIYHLKRIKE